MTKSDASNLPSLEDLQEKVDALGMKLVYRGAWVALGNAALLCLLAAFPFDHPMWQLCAGSSAIFLHGWGAWEIGSGISAWSRAAKFVANLSAEAFKEQALAARRNMRLHRFETNRSSQIT